MKREPNFTELGIFSVMWSEHCSYKNSRKELRKFPTTGERVLVKAGEENAGGGGGGGSSTSVTAGPSRSRWRATIIRARSSPSRARPPASAASSAIFSPWGRVPYSR
ncbi:MAG: hypothetical protein WDN28_20420 [Chthoniobacter sp.]